MLFAILRALVFAGLFIAAAILVARLVFPAPTRTDRQETTALPPAETGALAQALMQRSARHDGQTGISPLPDGMEAFVARMLLANAAVSSIDVQYYIWRADMTGHLLLKALQRAADRGVRVRLLLDDNGIDDLDDALVTLDAHPNIEVRLFNPFVLRWHKRLSYAFDFFRLNHRMHNKSFTVDGRASVLGGRNVGDEYFGTGVSPLQIDLDVLALGEVVPQISADFDRYWNSVHVHPVARVLPAARDDRLLEARLTAFETDPQFTEYRALLEASDLVASLARGDLVLEWTDVVLISDDPDRIFDTVPTADLFTTRLLAAVGPIQSRFDGVTPYFVPGAAGVEAFTALENSGVAVRMLTNSLEATDVVAVHAGYSKRRWALLRAGVELFELRSHAASSSSRDDLGPFGSSGSNLHAKTFAVDGARVFVGSFNFDPRSATLNTEMGLVIESAAMAQTLHQAFDRGLSDLELAWQVKIRGNRLIWVNATDQVETRREPGTSMARRMVLQVVGWLPVEWLL